MDTSALTAIVLAWMQQISPPARIATVPTYPTATETVEQREARYETFAADVAEVAQEDPMPREAAALLTAMAFVESGFARDVDVGPCDPARVRAHGCDGGRSGSAWQVMGLREWTRPEAARKALAAIRRSQRACRRNTFETSLAAYARGDCNSPTGQRLSRVRMSVAVRLLRSP